MKVAKKFLLLFTLFFCATVKGQNSPFKAKEEELLSFLTRINSLSDSFNVTHNSNLYDSLEFENDVFKNKLKDYLGKNPKTLKYSFKKLRDQGLEIATSADGLFRIYSWDTQTGGTAHTYENIFQFGTRAHVMSFNDDTSKLSDLEGVSAALYSKVYIVKTAGGIIYLGMYDQTVGNLDLITGVMLFSTKKDKLFEPKLLKTGNGLQSKIFYEYHPSLQPQITYNENSKTIFLPLISGSGIETRRTIKYKFTGKYFEKSK
ncbi:MAG TPA: hypothetical protein VGI82_03865 [Chitinophagaceae bacterium]|jgi:hypothetical protein